MGSMCNCRANRVLWNISIIIGHLGGKCRLTQCPDRLLDRPLCRCRFDGLEERLTHSCSRSDTHPGMGTVSESAFANLVEEVSASCGGAELGLFGPTSVSWRVARESVIFVGGGRAALLQLAHPYVAHAVDQHSATRSDPIGRFNRTFTSVFAMIFGDLEHAVSAAYRVRAIHDSVNGR